MSITKHTHDDRETPQILHLDRQQCRSVVCDELIRGKQHPTKLLVVNTICSKKRFHGSAMTATTILDSLKMTSFSRLPHFSSFRTSSLFGGICTEVTFSLVEWEKRRGKRRRKERGEADRFLGKLERVFARHSVRRRPQNRSSYEI